MKISILHPSRQRIEQAYIAYRHWTLSMSGTIDYEYILSVDVTDPLAEHYLNGSFHQTVNDQVIINDNQNVVMAANAAGKKATGDIIILISDDFKCFHNWDLAIVEALKNKSGVLKTFDGVQEWLVTLPILTKDYYDEQGYIYYPEYKHMFPDCDQTHKADLEGKLIIRNDIFLRHAHYSTKGGHEKDALNVKADGTWGHGEKVYLRRCKEKFGLGDVDIFNIRGVAHKSWLKKKLR